MSSAPATAPVFQNLGRRSAYLEVAERIRATIFRDKLALFQRMPSERELAAQFGVSRVVVREAIRTLESSGLVTVKKGPKGGIFVTQDYERPIVDTVTNLLAGGEANLDNLFEMRLLIEPHAAAQIAAHGSEADFAMLEGKIAEAEREHGADHSVRHRYIDFHRQVIRLAGNPLLAIVGETVLAVLYERVKGVLSADTSEVGLIMHRQLINACRNRQPEEARAIMAQDIEILSRRFAEFSATRPSPTDNQTNAKKTQSKQTSKKETPMVRHFDPTCPKCKQKFHVHHEDLRYAGVKLLCPYCQNEFFVDECDNLVEHDGTVTNPKQRAHSH